MAPRPIAYEYREGNALTPGAGDKSETGWINRARPEVLNMSLSSFGGVS